MSENQRQVTPTAGVSAGTVLRDAREAAGISHATISEALHLTVHYIKAIENDEYHKLPGLIFVKGYVRSYARYLKLDAEALVASGDRQILSMPAAIKSQTLAGNYTRKRNDAVIVWALAAMFVVVVGIGALWWFFGGIEEPTQTTTIVQTQSSAPVPVAQPASETVPAESSSATQVDSALPVDEPAAIVATPEAQNTNAQSSPAATSTSLIPAPVTASAPAVANAVVSLAPGGGRQINVVKDGTDQVQFNFSGLSWVEINDALNNRIYGDTLRSGDTLLVKGRAPFQILLGDGRQVKASFNAQPVDISSNVRTDNTARFSLGGTVTPAQPAASQGTLR